jgi:hypothetical protein
VLGGIALGGMYIDALAGVFAYLLSTTVLWFIGLYVLVATAENRFVTWREARNSIYPWIFNKKNKK